jgi:aminoglycoside/choline kinase family phosphotransferase
MRFDELDDEWDVLERACAGLPPSLVHGDFGGKNVRVQGSAPGEEPRIVVFDWEDAGRAVPSVDLAQVTDPSSRITARVDLDTYWSVIRRRWPECKRGDIDRLATCGTVFRVLAVIGWEAHHLAHPWANDSIGALRSYDDELSAAMQRLGWARQRERAGVP